MTFAILRTQKLKKGNLHGSSSHVTRERETPNADPSRQHLNRVLVGDGRRPVDLIQGRVAEIASERTAAGGKKLRSDSVLAVEYILTASPEHFSGKSKEEILKWASHSTKFLTDRHGKNIVSATLHMDEMTPHLHVYHVPEALDPNGRPTLSAKQYYGSRGLLTQLQTDYAAHMQTFDPSLKRGMTKSKARHNAIRNYYTEVNQAPTLKIPNLKTGLAVATPPRMIKHDTREDWAKDQSRSLQERFQERVKTLRERLRKALMAARHWKREFEAEKQRSAAYSAVVDDPSKIERWKKDAQDAKDQLQEQLAISQKASQTASEAVKERDYYKVRVQDLEHQVSASERGLKAICDAVGIKPEDAQEKAPSVKKLWQRDVLNRHKNYGHDRG